MSYLLLHTKCKRVECFPVTSYVVVVDCSIRLSAGRTDGVIASETSDLHGPASVVVAMFRHSEELAHGLKLISNSPPSHPPSERGRGDATADSADNSGSTI